MDTVYTEVKFGTAGPLMNFLGKVPEGKVFAGWKLNDKEVYAGGENFTFDKALAKDLGTNKDGVHGYLFSFKATFNAAEKKINVVFKTSNGKTIRRESMTVAYTAKYVNAPSLKNLVPSGYELASTGYLRIGRYNTVTAYVKVPVRKNISKLSFKGVAAYYEYTGRRIRPTVTVKDGRKVLRAGKDYTITYSNNIKRGKASIVITGKGSYTGRKVITFRIVSKNLR